MAYLTKAEYLERFDNAETISLTDPANAAINDTKLNSALQAGSDVVDSYAAKRYTLPISPVPTPVKNIVGDLAREWLYNLHPPEEVTDRADRARAWLRDLSKGVVELVGTTGALVEDAASDDPETYTPDQVFTPTLLDAYRGRLQ